jgi:hypothetical protein
VIEQIIEKILLETLHHDGEGEVSQEEHQDEQLPRDSHPADGKKHPQGRLTHCCPTIIISCAAKLPSPKHLPLSRKTTTNYSRRTRTILYASDSDKRLCRFILSHVGDY